MNQKYFKAAETFNLNFGMIGLPVPYKARSTKNKLLHVRDSLEYYFTRNWLLHSFYAKFLKKMKNFTEKELHPIPEFESAKICLKVVKTYWTFEALQWIGFHYNEAQVLLRLKSCSRGASIFDLWQWLWSRLGISLSYANHSLKTIHFQSH